MSPSEPPQNIGVAIIEDDRALREGLAQLIGGTPGLRTTQVHGSVEAALHAPVTERVAVLLLDVHLPGLSGTQGLPALQQKYPGAAILMLTVFEDEENIFDALCAGATGYLLKKTPADRLLQAIREVHEGGSPMSPGIARKVIRVFQKIRPQPRAAHGLTEQEVRLLALLADGYSYLAAAGQLDISVNTVRNYIRSVYQKLHVHSKSEAVSKALKQGLI